MLDYDELIVFDGTNAVHPTIKIHPPVKDQTADFACYVEINGFGQRLSKNYYGVTKVQSLCLAIRTINLLILNSADFRAGNFYLSAADGTMEPLTAEMLGENMDWT